MLEMENTLYDPMEGFTPISPGLYECHLVGFDDREFDSGSKVFNFTFQLADEVGKMDVPVLKSDGNGEYVPDGKKMTKATHLVGRKFKSVGIWLTPNPGDGEGWKNKNYLKFCENLGIEFDKVETKTKLAEIEEMDVLGLPAIARIGVETYEDKETQEMKKTMKVMEVLPWGAGVKMDKAEIEAEDALPF